MKRNLLLSTVVLALAACGADNRSSIEVIGRAAPSDAKQCKFSATGDRLFGPASFDVTLPLQLSAALYIKNNIADPNAISPGSVTDAKAWRAESVHVRLNPHEYVSANGAIPPLPAVTGDAYIPLDGQTTAPGGTQNVQFVDLLTDGMAQQLVALAPATGSTRIVLGVTLQGRTLDDARVDSGEWFFPVDVCTGCLRVTGGTCPTGTTLTQNTCTPVEQLDAESCTSSGG